MSSFVFEINRGCLFISNTKVCEKCERNSKLQDNFCHRQEIMVAREWGGRQFETSVLNEFLREFLVALA